MFIIHSHHRACTFVVDLEAMDGRQCASYEQGALHGARLGREDGHAAAIVLEEKVVLDQVVQEG